MRHHELDDSQAAELADGPEPLPDAAATTPPLELPGNELPALIRDEMPGLLPFLAEATLREPTDGPRRGLAAERLEAHKAPRVMVGGI